MASCSSSESAPVAPSSPNKRTAHESRATDSPRPECKALLIVVRRYDLYDDGPCPDENCLYVVEHDYAVKRYGLQKEWTRIVSQNIAYLDDTGEDHLRDDVNVVRRLMWASTNSTTAARDDYLLLDKVFEYDTADGTHPWIAEPDKSIVPPFAGGPTSPIGHVLIFDDHNY